MEPSRLDEALAETIAAGGPNASTSADHELTEAYAAHEEIDDLLAMLRMPPEFAARVARTVGDPRRIGRYPVIQRLGRGGFGSVYEAYDERLERSVAIKVADRPGAGLLDDARKAVEVRHDGIVEIYSAEEEADGSVFIVMEYLEGGSLEALLKAGRKFSHLESAKLVASVTDAVQHAHSKELIHRDLKPGNILFDAEGRPHVADFGLAVHDSQQRQLSGDVSGTLAYMSPEQVRGEVPRMDGRSDIWSLGVILYQLLTGQLPFKGDTEEELKADILGRDPKPPRQRDATIPPGLERIVLRCLRKSPEERYGSAAELAEELRKSVRPWWLLRRVWLLAGVTAVVASVLTAYGLPNNPVVTTGSPLPPLDGQIDVLVWRPDKSPEAPPVFEGVSVHRPGVAPVRVGDQYRVEVRLNRPAYAYLVCVDADAAVHVVYPWIPERGEARPEKEAPVQEFHLPRGGEGRGWKVEAGREGVTSFFLLARPTPLPKEVDLAGLFAGIQPPGPGMLKGAVFFKGGKELDAEHDPDRGTRGAGVAETDVVRSPLVQFHARVVDSVGEHFPLIRAVSYPDLGR